MARSALQGAEISVDETLIGGATNELGGRAHAYEHPLKLN